MTINTQKSIYVLFFVVLFALGTFLEPLSVHAATRSRRDDTEESRSSSRSRISSSMRRHIDDLDDDPLKSIRIPVALGVSVLNVSDTWGEARSEGRDHEGTDIFAPRGTPVASPSKAVVTEIGVGERGGKYVYTANPGGERFYYAHLDSVADDLSVGDVLQTADTIGYVGNTGNASGGATHLHFGIYKKGATNPYPRLTKEFTLEERIKILTDFIDHLTELVRKER